MTSAVDGLKQRFMAMSQPDADGVYRNGAAKRKARTELAMGNLTQLWNEVCEAVSFDVPATGIGLGAVGSLARGQVGPSSDLDLAVIYEPHALTDQQLNELANKLWYPIWDSGLDLDQSVRTVAQCEAVTDRDLPAAMGWLDVVPIAGDTGLIESTAVSILERWRKAARKRLPELLGSAKSRLDEFGRMAYINQPDIKEARGGLRDSVLVSALAASWLADRPHGTYDDAVERLLDVRDCIHLVAGKDTNMLLLPYQAKVAAMLGLADPTLPDGEREAKSIDDLQTLLARVGRQIVFSLDSTASRAEHSLTHDKPRFAFFQVFQPRGGGKRQAPTFDVIAPGVAKHEEEIVLAPGAEPAADPNLVLRVAVAAAEFGLPIAPGTLQNLKSALSATATGRTNRVNCSYDCWLPAPRCSTCGKTSISSTCPASSSPNGWACATGQARPPRTAIRSTGTWWRSSRGSAVKHPAVGGTTTGITRRCCSPASCMTSANDRGWPTMRRKALGMRPWSWNAWDSTATSSAGSRCWYASI